MYQKFTKAYEVNMEISSFDRFKNKHQKRGKTYREFLLITATNQKQPPPKQSHLRIPQDSAELCNTEQETH